MHHKPMTYILRSYWEDSEAAMHVVYYCAKDGERYTHPFDSLRVAKAFMTALDGLGFTKKRR